MLDHVGSSEDPLDRTGLYIELLIAEAVLPASTM